VPDGVKPSFVIFDIGHSDTQPYKPTTKSLKQTYFSEPTVAVVLAPTLLRDYRNIDWWCASTRYDKLFQLTAEKNCVPVAYLVWSTPNAQELGYNKIVIHASIRLNLHDLGVYIYW